MIDRLHGEIEGHEFNDRAQTTHCGAGADACKSIFRDRSIDDPLGPEFIQQALRDLVRTLILGHFLAHDEHAFVLAHFFGHGVAQSFTDGNRCEAGAFGNLRILHVDLARRLHQLRFTGIGRFLFAAALV